MQKGKKMLKLYIKDNTDGTIHEYGTDNHDALVLQEDGSLHYLNMQCMCGTRYPEEGYSFCREDGSIPTYEEDDNLIDIGGEYFSAIILPVFITREEAERALAERFGYKEEKRWKWKLNEDGSGTCFRCNTTQKNVWDLDNYQNYCGHCGAKMDLGEEE